MFILLGNLQLGFVHYPNAISAYSLGIIVPFGNYERATWIVARLREY